MIEYKILNNGLGVILNRQPQVVYEELCIKFTDAPENATAIIDATEEITLYEKLINNECKIVLQTNWSTIRVTLAVLDNCVPLQKWECEELKLDTLKDGGILVCANDLNLPQTIVDLRLEHQEIREENATIKNELAAIKKRLEEIMEAYDFT